MKSMMNNSPQINEKKGSEGSDEEYLSHKKIHTYDIDNIECHTSLKKSTRQKKRTSKSKKYLSK